MSRGERPVKGHAALTAGFGESAYTRRSLLGFSVAATAPGLSACVADDNQGSSRSPFVFEEQTGNPGTVDLRHAPQFYLGNPEAGFRVEVAWSLHCEYTQKLYRDGFDDLIEMP